jgi:hypothetical protein
VMMAVFYFRAPPKHLHFFEEKLARGERAGRREWLMFFRSLRDNASVCIEMSFAAEAYERNGSQFF